MIVKITSKRQLMSPAQELDGLNAGPDDRIPLNKAPDEPILLPRRIDYSKLGFLIDKIDTDIEPFDIEKFRGEPYHPSLRD